MKDHFEIGENCDVNDPIGGWSRWVVRAVPIRESERMEWYEVRRPPKKRPPTTREMIDALTKVQHTPMGLLNELASRTEPMLDVLKRLYEVGGFPLEVDDE